MKRFNSFFILMILTLISFVTLGQVEYVSTGTSTAYSVSVPGVFPLRNGIQITFKANVACGANPTLNVSGTGAIPITKNGNSASLIANDIVANQVVSVVYDGSKWQLITPSANTSSGTVTSVGISAPTGLFTVSGSPITSSGTLTLGFQTLGSNVFFASPNGLGGQPSFRSIVSGDLPLIPLSKGGTNASLTAVNGGIVYSDASAFGITSAGTSGQVLQSNGTAAPSWVTPSFLPSGTSGQTLRHNGSGWVANSFLFNDGSQIGIGNSSPQATLHISASSPRLTLSNTANNTTNGSQLSEIWFNDGVTSNPQAGIRIFRDGAVSGDAPTAMAFFTTNTGSLSNTEQMRLTKDGRLGIGTNSPDSKLSVSGGINAGSTNNVSGVVSFAIGSNNTVTGNRALSIGNYTQANNLGSMVMGDWSTSNPTILSSSADDQFSARFSGGYRFFTNSTNQVANGIFFAPGGNVGIGISNPLSKLHVHSGAIRISDAASNTLIYQTGTKTRIALDNPLEIAPNGAGVLFNLDDGDLTIDVATHINKIFQLNDSTQGLNKVLRSDAQGYASWVNLSSLPGALSNGTTNYLPKWSSSTSLSSTSLVYDNGNAVSIGTTASLGRLEVRNTSTSGYPNELVVNSNGSTDADIVLKTGITNMGIFGGGSTAKLGIWNYANSSELVTVLSTGNMGIGTNTPGTSRLNILIPSTDASNPFGITINNNYSGAMDKFGIDVNVDGGGSGVKYGISSSVVGLAADASPNYGYQVAMTPNGTGTTYGIFSNILGVGTGARYGIYNNLDCAVANSSICYGILNSANKPASSTGSLYGMRLNTFNDGTGTQYGIYLSNAGLTTATRYGIYSTGETMNYLSTGLGLGVVPTYQLHLSTNSAAKPTSNTWTIASDARLKTNVKPYKEGLSEILKINPIWFTYTGEAGMPKETGVGVIAQDLQKIAPYMVSEWTYYPNDNRNVNRLADPIDPKSKPGQVYLGVDNGAMTYMLINAIKEQQSQIEEQGKQIQKLILENEKLKSDIKSIKDNSGK